MRVYSSRAVAPVVAVVWLSASGLPVKIVDQKKKKEKIKTGGRLVGYTHTHTPLDGMRWNETECVYEGAITFLRDCSIYVAKKLLLLFST